MEIPQSFVQQVRDAYEHLYDLVYLRTHPLLDLLVPDAALKRKDRAWQLHHMLVAAVDELDPGPQAPAFSREWRRHRLMVLRYLDGLEVEAVADQIAISRRHYYREHEEAIEAIAHVLWDRRAEFISPELADSDANRSRGLSRVELMRLEIARSSQTESYSDLAEVTGGLVSILQERLSERNIHLEVVLPEGLPRLAVQSNLLRQLLLSLLGYFIERANGACIRMTAQCNAERVDLALTVEPLSAVQQTSLEEIQQHLAIFEELATLGSVRLEPLMFRGLSGVTLRLPVRLPKPILVVDDNEDMVELLRRFLTLHNYHVISATSALEAFDIAQKVHPKAITVDLMMPGHDGWDLLQMLLNHPTTRDIPIIVCSVLRQKELALALGATAFLEKPVTEQDLLTVLREVDRE